MDQSTQQPRMDIWTGIIGYEYYQQLEIQL